VLRFEGFRFFFYSLEGHEPPHIHVEHGDNVAKYWLRPVALAESYGFRAHELNRPALGDGRRPARRVREGVA
jgi:hypothetical protein